MDSTELASLDDLYSDKPKPTRNEPPPSATTEPSEMEAEAATWTDAVKPADPTEKAEPDKPAKVSKAETSGDDEDDEPRDVAGLKAALKATRQKARERETRAADYERQLESERRRAAELDGVARQLYAQVQGGAHQQQQPEPPDPFTDPAGALAYRDQVWSQKLEEVQQKADHAAYMARVIPSQRDLRSKHKDYDEMEQLFAEAAKVDPRLWAAIRQHEYPAELAYQVGKEIKQRQEIQKAGSFDQWIDQKVSEKLAAAQAPAPAVPTVPSIANPATPRPPPPQSLARMPSVTPRTAKAFNGPTPLNDLYK